jgi:hypothetical protein
VLDQRGLLLRAAVGFATCSMPSYDRALWALRTWLDSWSGIGHVAVGMAQQGYDLQLTRYDVKGWRATFAPGEVRGMASLIGGLLVLVALSACSGHMTAVGVPWTRTPAVTVIGPEADPRRQIVDEAVAFWNKTLEEIGAGFRLGPVTRVVQPVPEEALYALSLSGVGGWPVSVPQVLRDLPGDLRILLADSEIVSFAGPFDADSKRVVVIRGIQYPPMNLPNVARNVIAHELGHAIGLGHNGDPTMLMCGRPAPCRPALFRSDEPRLFPLTRDERRQLLDLYPPGWKPRSP